MNNMVEVIIGNRKGIVGKRFVIEHILVALLSDGHTIEDVPGVGNTDCCYPCTFSYWI